MQKKSHLKSKDKASPAKQGVRAARKAAQPQNILSAALKTFGEKGFAATRMEDVAKEAGITKGAIYLYFPSKEALLEGLVQRDLSPRIGLAASALDAHDGPLEPALRMLAATVLHFLDEGVLPVYARLIIGEANNFPALARFYKTAVVDVALSALGGMFSRSMARGQMRRMDPETAARLFIAPIAKCIIWRTIFGGVEREPFQPAPFLDAHIENFLRGAAPDRSGLEIPA